MNIRQLLIAALLSASAVPASAALSNNALSNNAIAANSGSSAGVTMPTATGAGSVDEIIDIELPSGQIIAK